MSRRTHSTPTKHHRSKLVKRTKTWLWWTFVGLLIYMPFHIFLAQSLSEAAFGLTAWKVAKDVVIILAAATAGILLWPKVVMGKSQRLRLLFSAMLIYALIHLLFLNFVDLDTESSLLATVYNNRLTALLVIGLAVGMLSRTKKYRTELVYRLILIVSGVVAVLGLIQYFLPADFMEHFGYTVERGVRPFFGIDSKADLPRIFSTIREPNALGAYLLVTLSLATSLYVNLRKSKRTMLKWSVFLMPLQTMAIFLTFSRSAWLGLIVTMIFIAWHIPYFKKLITLRNIALTTVGVVLISLMVYPSIRDSYIAGNVIFHSDETTTELGSSQKHLQYIKDGIQDVIRRPVGYGPGTAGIVSIRNERGTTLTENYYVQIAYEVGILGLVTFVMINYLVYDFLRRSPQNALRMTLMASFWGLVVVNMLLHTWSNEAVAVVWWMLAGYQIGLTKTFD